MVLNPENLYDENSPKDMPLYAYWRDPVLNQLAYQPVQDEEVPQEQALETQEPRTEDIASPTLLRLIEEVRMEEANSANAYNRMHNRHNRSR